MPPCTTILMEGRSLHHSGIKDNRSPSKSDRNRTTVFYSEKKDSVKVLTELDLKSLACISLNVDLAKQSGWYYGTCTSHEAKRLLQNVPVGTFMMRNSSDAKYLFALSVRTERGPTSVRISYSEGMFQIDCEEHLKDKMPRCNNVIELVHTHMAMSRTAKFRNCRWLERSGKRDLVITLKQPRRNCVSPLAHLARLAVNSTLGTHIPDRSVKKLPIAESVQKYLEEYPYAV